jgi:hypothetical protein
MTLLKNKAGLSSGAEALHGNGTVVTTERLLLKEQLGLRN